MSVTKIQRVKSVSHAVNYITRSDKTEIDLVYSNECSPEFAKQDFDSVLDEYNNFKKRDRALQPRMIIQSYDPSEKITPEQAHEYGKEFAENYLKGGFQYIVATHHDTEHIHNHIVFNDINYKTLEIFDSTRENTLNRMRNENDLISEKYGLKVIEETRKKHKYLTHKDYVSRAKGTSFKDKIENDIDLSITESDSYNSFLETMEKKGYEIKQGKNLAFKSPTGKKFMRTKTLGFNYLENSIKHRIENKDFIPLKPKIVSREWIDKNQEKFKDNKYLHRWASIQNINYLHEVNSVLYSKNISLNTFIKENEIREDFESSLDKQLTRLDTQIFKLESMADSFNVYKESHGLMIDFKKLDTQEEKEQYKKEHYSDFKKYDKAKKNISLLKKGYQITNPKQLKERIQNINAERKLIYESVNVNKDLDIDKTIERESVQKQRNKGMEL